MNRDRYLFVALVAALAGCPDPVRENLEAEQGPEVAGIPEGPLHRAGQPCLVCHREGGEGPEFSFGGTVYVREGESEPAAEVEVAVRDARGDERSVISNGAGNFWMPASEWKPLFPLRVELRADGTAYPMRTEIPRDGSCNTCHVASAHQRNGDRAHMPGVFVEIAR